MVISDEHKIMSVSEHGNLKAKGCQLVNAIGNDDWQEVLQQLSRTANIVHPEVL